LAEAQ
jgi:hypothetical protein